MAITNDLIGHYLRAIGYALDGVYWRKEGAHSLPELGGAAGMIALLEKRVDGDVKLRLGLCAAAEESRRQAVDHAAMGEDERFLALDALSESLLRAADIDPRAWKLARANSPAAEIAPMAPAPPPPPAGQASFEAYRETFYPSNRDVAHGTGGGWAALPEEERERWRVFEARLFGGEGR